MLASPDFISQYVGTHATEPIVCHEAIELFMWLAKTEVRRALGPMLIRRQRIKCLQGGGASSESAALASSVPIRVATLNMHPTVFVVSVWDLSLLRASDRSRPKLSGLFFVGVDLRPPVFRRCLRYHSSSWPELSTCSWSGGITTSCRWRQQSSLWWQVHS